MLFTMFWYNRLKPISNLRRLYIKENYKLYGLGPILANNNALKRKIEFRNEVTKEQNNGIEH